MADAKYSLRVAFDEDLYRQIQRLAQEQDCSMSAVVRAACEQAVRDDKVQRLVRDITSLTCKHNDDKQWLVVGEKAACMLCGTDISHDIQRLRAKDGG